AGWFLALADSFRRGPLGAAFRRFCRAPPAGDTATRSALVLSRKPRLPSKTIHAVARKNFDKNTRERLICSIPASAHRIEHLSSGVGAPAIFKRETTDSLLQSWLFPSRLPSS